MIETDIIGVEGHDEDVSTESNPSAKAVTILSGKDAKIHSNIARLIGESKERVSPRSVAIRAPSVSNAMQ